MPTSLQRTPPKNTTTTTSSDRVYTTNDLARLIMKQTQEITEMRSSMEEKLDQLTVRIVNVEGKLASQSERMNDIEKEGEKLQEQMNEIRRETTSSIDLLERNFKEHNLRLMNKSNLVLIGIPETDAGLDTAKKLMEIIMPEKTPVITNYRLGKMNPKKPPRPLRVTLSNEIERGIALGNCHKLKNLTQFAGISVKPQMTRTQRTEYVRSSPYHLRKRASTDIVGPSRTNKRRRPETQDNEISDESIASQTGGAFNTQSRDDQEMETSDQQQ